MLEFHSFVLSFFIDREQQKLISFILRLNQHSKTSFQKKPDYFPFNIDLFIIVEAPSLLRLKLRKLNIFLFLAFVSDALSEIEKDEELGPNLKGT